MKKLLCVICAVCLLLCGCAAPADSSTDETPAEEAKTTIRVGGLTGPTAMGMVKLMSDSDSGETENSYEFTLQSEAVAFVTELAKGEIDIAAVPANLASVIYNNTDGGVKVLAINTLGVLYVVERGDSVQSLADLAGKTIYATGAGAAPEYALRYLLSENGMDADKDITIQWCADTTEALSYIAKDANAVAMLPQPFATSAQMQVSDLRVAIDLNAEWEKLRNSSAMVTGALVVRSEFAEKYPQQLEKFMAEYEASVSFVVNNTEAAAELMGQYEIVKTPVALKALPYCNITFMSSDEMKSAMEGYLNVLLKMNPAAVGGKLPESDFYYGA
ncbi:MAG: ABC transporter substrate-binding protein [Bacillota bacterium]|nr:ABC transporter substrate-binding protein [Bacillota bacterium]